MNLQIYINRLILKRLKCLSHLTNVYLGTVGLSGLTIDDLAARDAEEQMVDQKK